MYLGDAVLAHGRNQREAAEAAGRGLPVAAPQVLRFRTPVGLELHRLKRAMAARSTITRTGSLWDPRDAAVDLSHFKTVSLLLQNPDFTAARDIADVINKEFGKPVAAALDSRRIDVDVAACGANSVPVLISRVQNLSINFRSPAKVVVNERTGTIVMGGDVRLSPVSVIQGSLTIDVETKHVVVEPPPLSNGKTETVEQVKTTVNDSPAQSIQMEEGANVDELIKGLHAIGATSHDIISILQAIKAEGFVFTAGQIPLDPSTGQIVGSDIATQTDRVLQNLQAVLRASGTNIENVVKTTVYLKNIADFSAVNEIYGHYFKSNPPARSAVQVANLPKDSLVEIEAIAVLSGSH